MIKNYILETCVDRVESAKIATAAGANRLELCSNLILGGTTPTPALFREVRKQCKNRIHVLIRPRFGDFCYSQFEFAIMKQEILQFQQIGADGIVIGLLKPDGELDFERMKELMGAAGNMSVTLHRAFDVCAKPFLCLEQAKVLGIKSILTSGQENTALEGITCLKQLIKRSEGRIDVLVGSGVNAKVIRKIYEETGATSYHMSGKILKESEMLYRKEKISMGLELMSEYKILETSGIQIKEAIDLLKQLENGN